MIAGVASVRVTHEHDFAAIDQTLLDRAVSRLEAL
jgi:hypothetical protein